MTWFEKNPELYKGIYRGLRMMDCNTSVQIGKVGNVSDFASKVDASEISAAIRIG